MEQNEVQQAEVKHKLSKVAIISGWLIDMIFRLQKRIIRIIRIIVGIRDRDS
jgi:hypothetical protein